MIISSLNFLGLKLYERKRITEEVINLSFDKIHCEDIGIYLVGEFPRLKYNHVSFREKQEWGKLVYETFSLSILNLVNKNMIEIVCFKDEKSYLGNAFKFNSTGYYFKNLRTSHEKIEDFFSNSILTFINISHSKYKQKNEMYKTIHLIFDKHLGENEEYNKPAKRFLIKNLNQYAKNFDWIKISKQKKMLGLYKDYQLEINEIYIPRIKMQHNAIKSMHGDLRNSNKQYLHFSDALKKCLKRDLRLREPSDDVD